MAFDYNDFWNRVTKSAPGLFDLGAGVYGQRAGAAEAAARLRAAQGPTYDTSMAGAQTALNQAGNMDPTAFAQQRLNAQKGLLAGSDAASEDSLLRTLRARGMLGAANYNPGVDGINPVGPGGAPMNPQLAAFYAARGGRDAKMAADSLDAGQKQIDNLVNRAGALQRTAAGTQGTGITARDSLPSRTAGNVQLLKGFSGIAKDSGMFGVGTDWLKRLIGGGGGGGSPLDLFNGPAQEMGADWYGF